MSNDSPQMLERRELLRRVAWMLGGTVSAPAALAILQGCSAREVGTAVQWTPKFFTDAQAELMSAIAEVIIPRTDTGGALDAGVPAFIDAVMADVYPPDAQQRFSAGMDEFDAAVKASGRSFLQQENVQRSATVKNSIAAALADEHEHTPFILMARELTLLGFYTSKVGITENMEYVAVPAAYHGCVPLSQMKKHVYWE